MLPVSGKKSNIAGNKHLQPGSFYTGKAEITEEMISLCDLREGQVLMLR